MTDDTIDIDGKRYRRMQVGEVYDETCLGWHPGDHLGGEGAYYYQQGQRGIASPGGLDYAPVDRPPFIVETWNLRTLRDDEEVRAGDLLVYSDGGAATVQAYDVGYPACVVALLGGHVKRRCGPLGEDL